MNQKLLLALLLAFFCIKTNAQEKVTLDSIALYEGRTVTICDKVQSTFITKSNTTMLNFGKPYPNQTFVVVIFEKDLVNFSYKPHEYLKDKTVCITGAVKIYKGMAEFIVKEENEIVIQ